MAAVEPEVSGNGGDGGGGASSTPLLGRTWTIVFGLIILAFFGVVFAYATNRLSSLDETHWSRLVYIYGGIEALAFGVVGALFGTTIQRQATDQASSRADENADKAEAERKRADQNQEAAAKGRALRDVIKGEANVQPISNQMRTMSLDQALAPQTPAQAVAAHLQRLSAAAEQLIPDE